MSTSNASKSASVAVAKPLIRHYQPPVGLHESLMAGAMRVALRMVLKPLLGPPWSVGVQRVALHVGSVLMPQDGRARVAKVRIGELEVERVTAKAVPQPRHAILYMHGGAFCVGSPRTHRSITTRLAALTGALVLVPHYRRTPEHAFPAQIEDSLQAYRQLLAEGFAPERIAIAGDSAGGNLTYMLSAVLRLEGLPQPAALVMMSPVVSAEPDPHGSATTRAKRDPMIRPAWVHQVLGWYNAPASHPLGVPKAVDLSAMPPSLIQVGEDEVLFDDSQWIVNAATRAGRHCELEVYLKRWHVFQSHAGLMPSSDQALARQAEFMKRHWAA
ncbi:MAG: alpha/beta hydrolase [Rubrivivax sp.]|nr:MAG: alpha/beta hydrolase [Rubrivivax sp.]